MTSVDTTIAVVSLADVKEYLNISDTSQDSILGFMINENSEKINTYLKRKVLSASYTEYYDGQGKEKLVLRKFPVSAVTSLYDDSERDFTADTLIDSEDYYVDTDNGIIELLDSTFYDGKKNVKVVYTAGYLLANVPKDIQEACKILISNSYARFKGRRFGIQSETIGDRTTNFQTSDLPPDVKLILDRYIDANSFLL